MGKILSSGVAALLFCLSLAAQTLRRPVAANYIGLGAYGNRHADVFSFTANQAVLAGLKNIAAGLYGERRYMLKELSFYTIAVALPVTGGSFGVKGGYYGSLDYHETQAGLAYGRKLGNKAGAGVQFNYYGVQSAGYGSAFAIGFEAGLIVHLTDKLNGGIHFSNPFAAKFNKAADERLPFVYTTGLGYEASKNFFISAEIEKEEDQPVNINAAIQYDFFHQLFFRAGVLTATSNFWMGGGFLLRSYRVDVTASYHRRLGITPGLLLLFNFSSSKNEEAN